MIRFALAAAVLGVSAACAPSDPIRVGFVGGLSGRVADLGAEGRNGAMLAVEARNKRGGIGGRRIELLAEDDEQNPEVAQRAVARLIAAKVQAIVGPMTSSIATAVVPFANEARVVMVSPTVTTNSLSSIDDHFFRVVAATSLLARKSAEHHYHRLGVRHVVPIVDQRNKSYTDSWIADYRHAFGAAGGRIADGVGFASGATTQFDVLARTALHGRPDAVLILANSVDAAMIAQHLRQLDSETMVMTSEWAATEQLIELGGRAVENSVVAQFIDRQSREQAYLDFRAGYLARFGRAPGFAGLTAFDATNVVLDGIEQQSPGQSLKETLLARRTFAGAQGAIVFDAFGDTTRETYVTTIRNGAFVALP